MKRIHLAAVLLALFLFVGGVAVGALADRYYSVRVVVAKTGAEDFRRHYITETRERLKLTPTQLAQLETILDETKAKVKAVRDSYHPAMIKIREEQITRVKAILTPEQIPAYEQLVAERQRHSKEQEEHDRVEEQKRSPAHRTQTVP